MGWSYLDPERNSIKPQSPSNSIKIQMLPDYARIQMLLPRSLALYRLQICVIHFVDYHTILHLKRYLILLASVYILWHFFRNHTESLISQAYPFKEFKFNR